MSELWQLHRPAIVARQDSSERPTMMVRGSLRACFRFRLVAPPAPSPLSPPPPPPLLPLPLSIASKLSPSAGSQHITKYTVQYLSYGDTRRHSHAPQPCPVLKRLAHQSTSLNLIYESTPNQH